MKRLLIVVATLVALAAGAAAPLSGGAGESETQEVLKQAEADWVKASVRRDKAWLEAFLADEVTVTHPTSGKVKTKAQEIADTIDAEMAVDSMTLGEIKVQVFGKPPFLGVVTGVSSEAGGGGHLTDRDRSYQFTDTFLKRDGRWTAVASHSSRLRR